MIDKNLLRSLDWSEDLINEVTRVSKEINDSIGEQVREIESSEEDTFVSGNSIYFQPPEINSSAQIYLELIKKKG
ncbi:MAG: hypothetical protein AB1427_14765 [Thermodesulfobacteriota bacterium]